jgi:hypothetical protein
MDQFIVGIKVKITLCQFKVKEIYLELVLMMMTNKNLQQKKRHILIGIYRKHKQVKR